METAQIIAEMKANLDLTRREPLKDLLFEAFKKTIVLGGIPAGTQLNEKQLSDALHISRTPIRSALNRLADAQVVERVPGTGVIVRGISIKDADEIYRIRCVLETLAATVASQRMSEEDFEGLRKLIERGERSNAEGDIDAVLENFNQFNEYIYNQAQMPRLRDIVIQLQVYSRYFRDVAIRPAERRELAFQEHWGIYLAMRFGDEAKIRKSIKAHLHKSLVFVTGAMRARGLS